MSDEKLRAALLASDGLLRVARDAARKLSAESIRGSEFNWYEVEQLLYALDDGDFERVLENNRTALEEW